MQFKTGDSSIITSTVGCGEIRQEIELKDPSQSTICKESDFDTQTSGKKICFNNGLLFEMINYNQL